MAEPKTHEEVQEALRSAEVLSFAEQDVECRDAEPLIDASPRQRAGAREELAKVAQHRRRGMPLHTTSHSDQVHHLGAPLLVPTGMARAN